MGGGGYVHSLLNEILMSHKGIPAICGRTKGEREGERK